MVHTKEKLDITLAMFNNHINNAFEKAKYDFINIYGLYCWEEKIQPLKKAGIMTIFDHNPNEHTLFFAERVKKYVNE